MSEVNSKEAQRLVGELLSDDAPCEATPAHVLRTQVMDSRIAKNEREWWARQTIAELEATIAELKQLADPLTKALYKEMSERHTAVCFKNKELREAARAVVEHKWIHHGTTCVYEDELDALAALLEKNDD